MSESAHNPQRKTALITGASGGIGYELAKLFAKDGYHIVLVARNREALLYAAGMLRETFEVPVTVMIKDLARPIAPEEIVAELHASGLSIDVLVNNAGFGAWGPFAQTELSAELDMARVNMVAPTQLTKLLLPGMLSRAGGRILNVASTAAFQPGPLMAVYYATKAYVLSWSEALANELRGSGVSVTALCPGPTQTGFHRRAGMHSSRLFHRTMDAETVAKIGYRGLLRGQTVVIPGFRNRLLALAVRWLPRKTVTRIVRYMQESREPIAGNRERHREPSREHAV